MSSGTKQTHEGMEKHHLLFTEGNRQPAGMQGYGAIGGGNAKAQEASGFPAVPSAPSATDSVQGYPSGSHGYSASSSGQAYPPTGPLYPSGQGYPSPSGPGYPPPSGPGYSPPSGQGYPPPSGQGYPPPGGQGYPPPSGPGYPPPSGQGYPSPSGPGYPPPGGGQGYPQPGPGYQQVGPSAPPGDGGIAEPFQPPPSGFLDPVPGYDSITFDDIPLLPPPSYDEATRLVEPKDRKPLSSVTVISQEQARSAMVEHCNANCCYGSTAAKEMAITNMNSTSAFHYTLETFTEQRSTAWTHVPFTGMQALDTPMNGPAPLPWDIPIRASEKFKTEIKKLEVPHTACVKQCHYCHGCGHVRCTSCHGSGHSRCMSCSGSGRQTFGNERRSCSFCHGSGHRSCSFCFGRGHRQCSHCSGRGQLKWFIQLTVKWTNHFEDYILERTAMPDELVRKGSGHIAFEEEQPWVFPVNHCPEPTVNKASKDLIEKHRRAFPNERQLLQRHIIRIVPVTEVQSQWKQKPFTFFVFGFENHVYTANYPQMCCCGCTIL